MRFFENAVGESSDWITVDEVDTATEQGERMGSSKDALINNETQIDKNDTSFESVDELLKGTDISDTNIELMAEDTSEKHLLENISTCSAGSSPTQYSPTIRVHDAVEDPDEDIKPVKKRKFDTFSDENCSKHQQTDKTSAQKFPGQ